MSCVRAYPRRASPTHGPEKKQERKKDSFKAIQLASHPAEKATSWSNVRRYAKQLRSAHLLIDEFVGEAVGTRDSSLLGGRKKENKG